MTLKRLEVLVSRDRYPLIRRRSIVKRPSQDRIFPTVLTAFTQHTSDVSRSPP